MKNLNGWEIPEYIENYLTACSSMVSIIELRSMDIDQATNDLETIHREYYIECEREDEWENEFGSIDAEEYLSYVHDYADWYIAQDMEDAFSDWVSCSDDPDQYEGYKLSGFDVEDGHMVCGATFPGDSNTYTVSLINGEITLNY